MQLRERHDRDSCEAFLGQRGAITITLHAAITSGGFRQLAIDLTIFEECAVRAFLVPTIEDALPECFERRVGHAQSLSSRLKCSVNAK